MNGGNKMVEKGHLYTERYSVGQFKLYFALENGEGNETVRVLNVNKGFKITVTAITIIPYNDLNKNSQYCYCGPVTCPSS